MYQSTRELSYKASFRQNQELQQKKLVLSFIFSEHLLQSFQVKHWNNPVLEKCTLWWSILQINKQLFNSIAVQAIYTELKGDSQMPNYICSRDFCLFWNIMELDWKWNLVPLYLTKGRNLQFSSPKQSNSHQNLVDGQIALQAIINTA